MLDANVFVSAILRPDGPPGFILEWFRRDAALDLVLAPAIVDEVMRVLAYPKIRKMIRGDIVSELWFEDIVVLATLVANSDLAAGSCAVPDDDKYISAAIEGRAAWVVSGDRQLLALGERDGIRIVLPRTFLDLLEARNIST